MGSFVRYAVYYLPPEGSLARFGAAWLGWDVATGRPVAQPAVAGVDLAGITQTPRKYGFHATLKPPFPLAAGQTVDALDRALSALAADIAPVTAEGLVLSRLGGFLALTPAGDPGGIDALAARLVAALDGFRAPAGDAELARRRKAGLTPAQDANLLRWGYPYVMEEFRFHMTLTGRLEDPEPVRRALQPLVEPILPRPFVMDTVSLVGERADGMFELVQGYALSAARTSSA